MNFHCSWTLLPSARPETPPATKQGDRRFAFCVDESVPSPLWFPLFSWQKKNEVKSLESEYLEFRLCDDQNNLVCRLLWAERCASPAWILRTLVLPVDSTFYSVGLWPFWWSAPRWSFWGAPRSSFTFGRRSSSWASQSFRGSVPESGRENKYVLFVICFCWHWGPHPGPRVCPAHHAVPLS